MIKITFNPKKYDIKITGHADHGKKGEDIVCSAISTLFYTLGESLYQARDMLEDDFIFENDNGKGHIWCRPKKEFEANVSLIWWTVLNGFDLVAKNYEKNVKLDILGGK
jgi:uncharacterized protein YsxB (DUF464 family)